MPSPPKTDDEWHTVSVLIARYGYVSATALRRLRGNDWRLGNRSPVAVLRQPGGLEAVLAAFAAEAAELGLPDALRPAPGEGNLGGTAAEPSPAPDGQVDDTAGRRMESAAVPDPLLSSPGMPADARLLSDDERRVIGADRLHAFLLITTQWGIPLEDQAALLDVRPETMQAWRRRPPTGATPFTAERITRLGYVIGIAETLRVVAESRSIGPDTWVRRPNSRAAFRGLAPLTVMRREGIYGLVRVLGVLQGLLS